MTPDKLDEIRERALTDSPFDEGRDAYNDRDALLEEIDRLTAQVQRVRELIDNPDEWNSKSFLSGRYFHEHDVREALDGAP